MYLLYRNGLVSSRSIRALLFTFRPGKDFDRFSLDSCTGWLSHTVRLRKSGTYEFILDLSLSSGSVNVCLIEGKKIFLLKLNSQMPAGRAELNRKRRYYLRWEFKSASGKCELRWLSFQPSLNRFNAENDRKIEE